MSITANYKRPPHSHNEPYYHRDKEQVLFLVDNNNGDKVFITDTGHPLAKDQEPEIIIKCTFSYLLFGEPKEQIVHDYYSITKDEWIFYEGMDEFPIIDIGE